MIGLYYELIIIYNLDEPVDVDVNLEIVDLSDVSEIDMVSTNKILNILSMTSLFFLGLHDRYLFPAVLE